MTIEQKQKKPGLIKIIFKWLGLSILTVLFLLALVFDAPTKFIIFLLIILAAFTALPRPARKWFWLGVGAVALILLIWIFLPEDDIGWRPYTFDEELAALETKYAIPDEKNAAPAYYEILETLDIDSNQPKFFIKSTPSSRSEPWFSKDHPETAQWLKGHQETIEKLIQISGKEKCLFPFIIDSVTQSENMESLAKIRRCVFLLIACANNDIAEGRTDDALKKYICILQIANHLYQQPEMNYHQMSVIDSLSLEKLNRFVIEDQPTAAQLELISTSIKNLENNWSRDLSNMLDFEKLYAKNQLSGMVYEINPKGKTRFSRGSLSATLGTIQSRTYQRRKCAKLGMIFAWLYIPSSPEKISEFVDAGFEKHYAMTEPDFDWNTQNDQFLPRFKLNYGYMVEMTISLTCPVYYRLRESYLRYLSLRRGSRLLIAIRQYKNENGKWPDSLDDIATSVPAEALIDPAGGKFDYENHGERFSLYGKLINIWPQ
ncbi:MAG: hypothetical protein JW715_16125 [Sedimentisphaerales bacterium]|nr:hypothetical protein [Sedimentisphaerales bacterium]